MLLKKDTTPTIIIFMSADADGSVGTGLTVHAAVSKNGGAFANATNSVSEISRGMYSLALTASETDTEGALIVSAWAAGIDATYANQDTDYNEWREVHQVYDALYAQTESDVYVNAALTQASWEEGADRMWRRPTSEIESAAHTGIDTLTVKSPIGLLATQLHKIETDSATTPANITVYQSDDATAFGTRVISNKVTGTQDPNALSGWSDS